MSVVRTIIVLAALLLLSSCATVAEAPDGSDRRYAEIIGGYPQEEGGLKLPRLTHGSLQAIVPADQPRDVFIFVHPGYSFFFNGGMKKQRYHGAKFRMQELQFTREALFVAEQARRGNIVVLIVPGDYPSESVAPRAYTSYLNAAAGASVFYLPSVTSSNGNIAGDDMVVLFQFLQRVGARKVLLGGGYIGRCQREFHGQLASYYTNGAIYVIREISTISPEDVSEREAGRIADGIEQSDYSAAARFLSRKLDDDINILSLSPTPNR